MSESSIPSIKHQQSLFSIAAWISLVAPVTALGVMIALLSASGHTSLLPPPSRQFTGNVNGWALWIDFGSLILGLFSLCGIPRPGAGFILWKAVPGILLSGALGFCHFTLVMMSSIIC